MKITVNRHGSVGVEVIAREHRLIADTSVENGGADEGFDSHELLLSALGSCMAITCQMYANRKGWPLISAHVEVEISSETKEGTVILRRVRLEGDLSAEQRERLLDIADKCPIHKLLTRPIKIETSDEA